MDTKSTRYAKAIAFCLSVYSAAAFSEPSVVGNTIFWPDDGWYQVQTVTDKGIVELCNGTRFCEVPDGTYIVINHSKGQRFEGVVAPGTDSQSELTIEGNIISWPDNGWYQVQTTTDEGIVEVCNGTRFCEVPDGTYIVINHSRGQRFEGIVVPAITSESELMVEGNLISWPDNGWYQVQAVTDSGITEVCNGTRFCEVSDGTYIVINHTTGERFENLLINAGGSTPEPEIPQVIREQTWQPILRRVVALINTDRALDRRDMLLSRFSSLSRLAISENNGNDEASVTLSWLGLTRLPQPDPANNPLVSYACTPAGTLTLELRPGVNIYSAQADNCFIEGLEYHGSFFYNGAGREGAFSRIESMNVTSPEGEGYSLTGSYQTSFDRVDVRRSSQWTNAAMSEFSTAESYSITEFNMDNRSAAGPDFTTAPARRITLHTASVQGGFFVSGDWTENQQLEVSVNLGLDASALESEIDLNNLPSQWQTGMLLITAEDGSWLSLQPSGMRGDLALVQFDGMQEPQLISWRDGYQIQCFGLSDDFPDCQ